VDAFVAEDDLPWPRVLRRLFSDPLSVFEQTVVSGRGTEEMKTNDVSGRFGFDGLGLSVDVGRPNACARFSDVEQVARALADAGVVFAQDNPVTALMEDPGTGRLPSEIASERVLSAVLEGTLAPSQLPAVLTALDSVGARCSTAFSAGLVIRTRGMSEHASWVESVATAGRRPMQSVKINLGLGRSAE